LAIAHGRSPIEDHHVLGRANDPITIPVPGNLHRQLSDRQRDWPRELRRHSHRDPLIWMATALLSHQEMLALSLALLDWLIPALPTIAAALRETYGEEWWIALELSTPWTSP
jgi:hypothetical protein